MVRVAPATQQKGKEIRDAFINRHSLTRLCAAVASLSRRLSAPRFKISNIFGTILYIFCRYNTSQLTGIYAPFLHVFAFVLWDP